MEAATHVFTLVGMKFRGKDIVALVDGLKDGQELTLEREPSNEYDAKAVKVMMGITHIGYIKASENATISAFLDKHPEDNKARLTHDRSGWPMVEVEI